MTDFRITKFEQQPEGHFTARVCVNGDALVVHDRYGSWFTEPDRNGVMREVVLPVAQRLTRKLPRRLRSTR